MDFMPCNRAQPEARTPADLRAWVGMAESALRRLNWVICTQASARPTDRYQDNPSGVGRLGGQAGTRSPTLRPHHRKTSGAGPEHLPTSSLPTRRGWLADRLAKGERPYAPILASATWVEQG